MEVAEKVLSIKCDPVFERVELKTSILVNRHLRPFRLMGFELNVSDRLVDYAPTSIPSKSSDTDATQFPHWSIIVSRESNGIKPDVR